MEEMITKMNMMEEEIKKYRQTNQINNSNSFNTIKNNKIQINNYGCENIDYITDKVFKKLLNDSFPLDSLKPTAKILSQELKNVRCDQFKVVKETRNFLTVLLLALEDVFLRRFALSLVSLLKP